MNITLKPIKNKNEYHEYLNWIDMMFEKKIKPGTKQGHMLQIALLIVKHYEDVHYKIPVLHPVDAIKIKMKEKNLRNNDLVGIIGSKGYISALLNKKKPLTLELAKIFHKELGIPAEVLLS